MTQTQLLTERRTDNAERAAPTAWSNASKIVESFSAEPLFIQTLYRQGIKPTDRTTAEYANAFALYAQDYCDVYGKDGTIEQDEIDRITLLANAPSYLHIQKDMRNYENQRRGRRLSRDEQQDYVICKEQAIWYNQNLADYAYSNPDAKLSDLNRALVKQSLSSFPRETNMVEKGIKQATYGARTEAVSRQLLDRTPIDYTPGTVEDDLRGGDIIIKYKGKRIKLDIKSSLGPIAQIHGGYHRIESEHITYAILKQQRDRGNKERHVIILFPGFTDSDLGDSLSLKLPEAHIQQRADFVAKQLQLAVNELQI